MSDVLGCEEGLECSAEHVGRHPVPGVADANYHVLPCGCLRVDTRLLLVQEHVGSLESKFAAAEHRIARVDGQIYKCRLELIGVNLDLP